jgi:hypothetical protein
MVLPPATFSLLRRAFSDVCRGYSSTTYRGQVVYIKHLSHSDHELFEETQERFRQDAIKRGALSEADKLADLIKRGRWSQEKEDDTAKQRDAIVQFEEGKRNMVVPSMIKTQEAQIKAERDKLNKMLVMRAEQMGITAETYSQQRLNDHYILHNLYVDKELSIPLFNQESFDDLSDAEIQTVVDTYNGATECCSDENLRLLCVQDFFISYYSLVGDSLSDFFGRPICEMTYYQVRLGGVSRYYRSLMENTDMSRIPPNQRNDPDALDRAFSSQKNQSKMAAEGRVPNVGLTKDDVRELGLEGQMAKLPTRNMGLEEMISHVQKTSQPVSR